MISTEESSSFHQHKGGNNQVHLIVNICKLFNCTPDECINRFLLTYIHECETLTIVFTMVQSQIHRLSFSTVFFAFQF